jgi:molecular chaperone DnaK (HSP70)
LSGGTSHTPKIARLLQNLFPETTTILAPSTSATAINPSDLAARGAAFQASLIQEFDKEDIQQSIDPVVTVTPHLSSTIGVQLISTDDSAESGAIFQPLVNAETALPARRIAQYAVAKEGGDVLVRVCEGAREIKVTKPEPKPKEEKDADEEDEDFDSDDEEEIRELVWKVTKPITEIAIKDVKAGGKVEVMININSDLGLQITAREVGAKGGVRVAVETPKATENGSA